MSKRFFITGAPGTGKNWLAKRLSNVSSIKYYDTDEIAWKKKYTKKRTFQEKYRRLDNISKKDEWIVCGSARSYLGNIPKRAQIIIILREFMVVEAFRIFRRYIKRKLNGQPGTLKEAVSNLAWGYNQFHKQTGERYKFFQSLQQKYPKKTLLLSKKGKHQFLQKYRP